MTAIQNTTGPSAAAVGSGQGSAGTVAQHPRQPQQRTAHSLEQRGMRGRPPSGLQQGQAPVTTSSTEAGKPQMNDVERTNSAAMNMNAQFNAQKTLADTLNGMISGMADSASKAINASSEAARGIRV